MSGNVNPENNIGKLAFSPIVEVLDRDNKIVSSTLKAGGVDGAVQEIASSSREVCAAAIKSLNFKNGSKLDLEMIDGAIATLQAVISNKPSPMKNVKGSHNQNIQEGDYELKDSHKELLGLQLKKLQALRALHDNKNGEELIAKNPDGYQSILDDIRKIELDFRAEHLKLGWSTADFEHTSLQKAFAEIKAFADQFAEALPNIQASSTPQFSQSLNGLNPPIDYSRLKETLAELAAVSNGLGNSGVYSPLPAKIKEELEQVMFNAKALFDALPK